MYVHSDLRTISTDVLPVSKPAAAESVQPQSLPGMLGADVDTLQDQVGGRGAVISRLGVKVAEFRLLYQPFSFASSVACVCVCVCMCVCVCVCVYACINRKL